MSEIFAPIVLWWDRFNGRHPLERENAKLRERLRLAEGVLESMEQVGREVFVTEQMGYPYMIVDPNALEAWRKAR